MLQSEDGEVAVVERTSRCFHQERSSVLLQMRVVYNFSKLKNRHVFSVLCMGVHTCLSVHVGIREQPVGVSSLHCYVDSRHITQFVRLVISAILTDLFLLVFLVMYVCECSCLWSPEEGVEAPRDGITGCEQFNSLVPRGVCVCVCVFGAESYIVSLAILVGLQLTEVHLPLRLERWD